VHVRVCVSARVCADEYVPFSEYPDLLQGMHDEMQIDRILKGLEALVRVMELPMLNEHRADWIIMYMMSAAAESGSIQTYLQEPWNVI